MSPVSFPACLGGAGWSLMTALSVAEVVSRRNGETPSTAW